MRTKPGELQAVFFDAGGVLLYVPQPWPARMAAELQALGHAVTEEDVQKARSRAQLPPWPKTLEEESQYWPVVYAAMFNEFLVDGSHRGYEDVHERVWWVNHALLFDDSISALEAVRNRGLRLGLISNASPSMQIALERLGISSYFDSVVISDVLGILKPDRRIFEHALDAIGVSAAGALFVDDIPENVNAARELGMTAFLLDRVGQYPDATSSVIRNLSEIRRVI